jgi:hypothetical protein
MTLAPNARSLPSRHQPPNTSLPHSCILRAGVPIPTGEASQPASRAPLLLHCTQHTRRVCPQENSRGEPSSPAQPAGQPAGKARQGKARQASRQASTAPTRCSHAADHWRKSLMRRCTTSLLGDFLLGLHCVRWRGRSTRAHTLRCLHGRAGQVGEECLLACLFTYLLDWGEEEAAWRAPPWGYLGWCVGRSVHCMYCMAG